MTIDNRKKTGLPEGTGDSFQSTPSCRRKSMQGPQTECSTPRAVLTEIQLPILAPQEDDDEVRRMKILNKKYDH